MSRTARRLRPREGLALTLGFALFWIPPTSWSAGAAWGIAAIAAGLCWIDPRSGALLWVAASGPVVLPLLQRRNAVITISVFLLLVLTGVLAARTARRRELRLPDSKLTLPLVALAGIASLSLGRAVLAPDPALARPVSWAVSAFATMMVVGSPAAAWVTSRAFPTERALLLLRNLWIAVAVALALRTGLTSIPPPRWSELISAYGGSLLLASVLHAPRRTPWLQALGLVCAAGLLAPTILLQLTLPEGGQWISGWIMLGLPALILLTSRWPFTPLAALAGGGALVALRPDLVVSIFRTALAEGDFGRLDLWQDSLRLVQLRPLLGVGPGGFVAYGEVYGTHDFLPTSAHSAYLQVAAEVGLLGLVALAWVLWRALRTGWWVASHSETAAVRALAWGLTAPLAGVAAAAALGDYIIPAYHNGGYRTIGVTFYSWIAIGALMAAEGLTRGALSTPRDDPGPPGSSPAGS
jgi:O-antigen ligase